MAGDFAERVTAASKLVRKSLGPEKVGVGVMKTVTADLVSGGRDFANQVRVVFGDLAEDKEGCANVQFVEEGQDSARRRNQLAAGLVAFVVLAEDRLGAGPAGVRSARGPTAVIPLVEVDREDDPALSSWRAPRRGWNRRCP